MRSFETFLKEENFIIFPGPLGSELHRRGYETKIPLWSASANEDAWDLVKTIHEDYFKAGADLNITNTFTSTPRRYKLVGKTPKDAYECVKKAVDAARQAQKICSDRETYIGGSYSPLEQCFTPSLVPSKQELIEEHSLQVEWLCELGVDFLIPETINHTLEAEITAQIASQSGLPFIIAFVVDDQGNLLDGTPLKQAVEKTNFPGRVGVALNCRPIETLNASFPYLAQNYNGPIGLYANGFGRPDEELGWVFETNEDTVSKFVKTALEWKDKGVKMIGGCCGMNPEYIQALSDATKKSI